MFYVYTHTRKDNDEIFYIGKGKTESNSKFLKAKYARAYSVQNRTYLWLKIVDEAEYKVDIVHECEDEYEALKIERELINTHKTKMFGGTLVNIINYDCWFEDEKEILMKRVKEKLGIKPPSKDWYNKPIETSDVMLALNQLS